MWYKVDRVEKGKIYSKYSTKPKKIKENKEIG
jgi:hypothetical protein